MTNDTTETPQPEEQGEPNEVVRTQDFETPGPLEIDIGNSIGPVRVELSDTLRTHVTVRHDRSSGGFDWRWGLSGLLSWVSEQFGEAGIKPGADPERVRGAREPIAEAVRQTRIELTGTRVVVRSPNAVPLRTVPLAITVEAPMESQIGIRSSTGEVTIMGQAGRVQIHSGSAAVSVDRATGAANIRTGSGRLRLGAIAGGVQARSGSGDVEIASVEAPSSVVTGSGNIWLGTVTADVLVRSGAGDITVAEAAEGQTELITGSGELRVQIRRGVAAEVDLTSSTGTASSDLPVADEPPDKEPPLKIFGRTGSGAAVLATAV